MRSGLICKGVQDDAGGGQEYGTALDPIFLHIHPAVNPAGFHEKDEVESHSVREGHIMGLQDTGRLTGGQP